MLFIHVYVWVVWQCGGVYIKNKFLYPIIWSFAKKSKVCHLTSSFGIGTTDHF